MSIAAIGTNGDGANHQYDIQDFAPALVAGNLPAVSFLKASFLSGRDRPGRAI
jgi:phospholipase C